MIQLKESFFITMKADENKICIAYEDQRYYDCSELPISSFPHDQLNSKIRNSEVEILNISSTSIGELSANDLKPYTNLREMVMQHITDLNSLSPDFLTPAKKLEIFIMDFTDLKSAIKIPASMKIFHANNVSITTKNVGNLNLTNLVNLTEISLASNDISGLPLLDPISPLTHINLKYNHITNVEYIDLAPFCKLEWFELETYSPGKEYAEKCCNLLTWLTKHGVYTELNCGIVDGYECDPNKDINFNNKAIELYDQCLANLESPFNWIFPVSITVAAVLFLTFVFLTFHHYRSAAVKKNDDSENIKTTEEISTNEEEYPMDTESIDES